MGASLWMTCEIKSGRFVGAGDPTQLRAILAQFRSLVETETVSWPNVASIDPTGTTRSEGSFGSISSPRPFFGQ
jgi:immunity protein 53 of polymorphic toxin system